MLAATYGVDRCHHNPPRLQNTTRIAPPTMVASVLLATEYYFSISFRCFRQSMQSKLFCHCLRDFDLLKPHPA